MREIAKKKVDVFVSQNNLIKLWELKSKIGANNESQTINYVLYDYFKPKEEDMGIERLNKALAEKDTKILNLEFELKTMKARPLINEPLTHEVKK